MERACDNTSRSVFVFRPVVFPNGSPTAAQRQKGCARSAVPQSTLWTGYVNSASTLSTSHRRTQPPSTPRDDAIPCMGWELARIQQLTTTEPFPTPSGPAGSSMGSRMQEVAARASARHGSGPDLRQITVCSEANPDPLLVARRAITGTCSGHVSSIIAGVGAAALRGHRR